MCPEPLQDQRASRSTTEEVMSGVFPAALALLSCFGLCISVPSVVAAQATADTSVAAARRAFDFLIGTWHVATMTDSGGRTTASRGEVYEFEKGLGDVMIVGVGDSIEEPPSDLTS